MALALFILDVLLALHLFSGFLAWKLDTVLALRSWRGHYWDDFGQHPYWWVEQYQRQFIGSYLWLGLPLLIIILISEYPYNKSHG